VQPPSRRNSNHLIENTGVELKKDFMPFTMNFADRKAIDKALLNTKYEDKMMQDKANLGLRDLL
jgi:hypothetical protein